MGRCSTALLLGVAWTAFVSCKTDTPRQPKKADLTLETLADEPPEPVVAAEPEAAAFEMVDGKGTDELQGFDLSGPAVCLPLPEGRECLERTDEVEFACAKASGTVLICEDCSSLCSVEVDH